MNKTELISLTKDFLMKNGISENNYIVSLQGPTFIFTEGIKLNPEIKSKMELAGIKVMGG